MLTFLYVHIGNDLPKYLLKNIERTRMLFPQNKISLVTNSAFKRKWAEEYRVDTFEYCTDQSFEAIFKYGNLEETFRNGYWRFTLERLIAINSYQKKNSTEKILHIESDVIIMPNFPEDELASVNKVCWMNYGNSADIGALVYFPNSISGEEFYQDIKKELIEQTGTDMEILWRMRRRNPGRYGLLPIISEESSYLINRNSKHIEENSYVENQIPLNSGIFDGFGLGLWLFGFDPRNKFGFTIVHTREVIDSGDITLDASQGVYSLTQQGELSVHDGTGKFTQIFSLHIHSKNNKILSPLWLPEMQRLLSLSDKNPTKYRFQPGILVELTYQNLKNRSFISFVSHTKLIKKLKSRIRSI